jgi:hypothetical protein
VKHTYSIIAQSQVHPLWTKLVAKYMEKIYRLCLGRRGRTQSDSAATVGKASHCTALEKRSKLKLRVSPREKLLSDS